MRSRLVWSRLFSVLQRNNIRILRRRFGFLGDVIGGGLSFEVTRYKIPVGDLESFLSIGRDGLLPLGETVAIKRIKPRKDRPESEEDALNDLVREVIVLARANLRTHENIVRMHCLVWDDRGTDVALWPSLVMEYCHITLAELQAVAMKPLSNLVKCQLMQQIGSGLDAVHEEAFIHGDLKSENILVQIVEDNILIPKLSDFGSAIMVWESEELVHIGGTDPWRAPEVRSPSIQVYML
jgi:serine/threonine protein kinase